MKLKYMSRQDRIESIQSEYSRVYPGRTILKLSFNNEGEYVITGSLGSLFISEELVCDMTPVQFCKFIQGRHPL
jgi:hypothetical protein